ncbi:hypothetical protein [Bartonella sp. CB178]|uniref:hypothetical protein n=1 Tax=Bartonella sp. CB178 TaxID=3112255 RepID=UPI00300E13F4
MVVIFDRFLLISWAVMLSFFCVSWLGTTHILSELFSIAYVSGVADVLFFLLSALFAGILWWSVPRPLPLKMRLAAFLPPALALFFFIVF